MATGYLHADYVKSLGEFGKPYELVRSGGWILERYIPETTFRDAIGPYPLFFCRDWQGLPYDLGELNGKLVSLALVTDPFADLSPSYLDEVFDVVIPFKEHYIADLALPVDQIAGKKHQKNARRASRKLNIEACLEPVNLIEEWNYLYDNLIIKHNISGIKAFSRKAFAIQLSLPGTVLLRAVYNNRTIAAQLYYFQGDVVHCHLGAADAEGYEKGAIAALDLFSLEYFTGKARWLNLGGGSGLRNNGEAGLSKYKEAWTNETRLAYFCGKIFNHQIYHQLSKPHIHKQSGYFPLYREGEFT